MAGCLILLFGVVCWMLDIGCCSALGFYCALVVACGALVAVCRLFCVFFHLVVGWSVASRLLLTVTWWVFVVGCRVAVIGCVLVWCCFSFVVC